MLLWILLACSTVVMAIGLITWLLRRQTIGDYGNRYVLVTGCNSGFGNLLAKRLDTLGFHVFAACHSDRGVDELNAVTSDRLVTLTLDVTNEQSVLFAREFVKHRIPVGYGLWALVNNAGISGPMGPVDWLNKGHYAQTLNVNLLGLIDVTLTFLPLIREGQGRVVNMSSILAKVGMGPSPYVVSKCAVEGFSDTLRLDLLRHGVTVVLMQPGFFVTNLLALESMTQKYKESFTHAPHDVRVFYGEEFLDKAKQRCGILQSMASTDLTAVTDAYVHALTARYPRARYIVGRDANVTFRILWNLPQWMKDRLLSLQLLEPQGTKAQRRTY